MGPGCDYTDDTICTVAVAEAAMSDQDYASHLQKWCRKYPHPMGSYGGNFNVQDPNNPNQNRYWSIPMNHGRHENEGFVWSMRPELVEAALEAKQKGLLPDVGHGLVDDDSIADDIPEWIVNRGEDQKNLVLPWIKAYKDNWDWLHKECIAKKPSSDFRKDTREGYKWLCTEHFRQTFDIDAEDFADIIEKSLKHSENLLAGQYTLLKILC